MADVTVTCTMEDVDVSNYDIDDIIDKLGNAAADLTREDVEIKLKTVVAAAREFQEQYNIITSKLNDLINTYKQLLDTGEAIQYSTLKSIEGDQENLSQQAQTYNQLLLQIIGNQETQGISEKMYNSVFNFQAALNDFLNQTVVLTIVFGETGEIYTTDSHDYAKFLKYEIDSAGNLSARFGHFKDLVNDANLNMQSWQQNHQPYSMDVVDNILWGRQSALWRYNHSHSLVYKYSKQRGGLILWHQDQSSSWSGRVWVWNKGDINEAYATLILSHTVLNKNNAEDFLTHEINAILNEFMPAVVNVDSQSGALVGDYSSDDGKLQYAIKSSQASALGYQQFCSLANIVLQEQCDPQKLQEWMKTHKGNTRNFEVEDLNDIINTSISNELQAAAGYSGSRHYHNTQWGRKT